MYIFDDECDQMPRERLVSCTVLSAPCSSDDKINSNSYQMMNLESNFYLYFQKIPKYNLVHFHCVCILEVVVKDSAENLSNRRGINTKYDVKCMTKSGGGEFKTTELPPLPGCCSVRS